jgi:hypothetical protein
MLVALDASISHTTDRLGCIVPSGLHCYNDIWAALRAGQRAALVRLTRSALVCYTSGLDNTGCAIRLRQQANEEWRWSDSSWNWWRRYRVL